MRSHVKGLLFGVSMLMGLLWASEAAAIPSGGSRLLFYFSNRSFSPGPATNANTLIFLTNASESTPAKFAVKYYRGPNCAETVPVIHDVAPGQTLTFDSSAQAPTFEEGIMEAWAVNGAGLPVRFDFGVGNSAVIDRNNATAVRLPAARLHSDNRVPGVIGSPLADNTVGKTFAPLVVHGTFVEPSLVTARLILFAPGTAPGTVASDRLLTVNFRQPNGGGAVNGPLNIECGRTLTLAQVRGLTVPQFQAAFPAGGHVAASVDGQEKGVSGWFLETVQLGGGVNLLLGQPLQSSAVVDETAHP